MKLFSQKDVDKKALKGARICVLGYGSQGRAHALNLKDSGFDVVIGVRKGDSWKKAKKDGLPVAEPADAVKGADLIAMLAPDLAQKSLYNAVVGNLKKGATLLFAHGFNIHFKQIRPRKDLDVVLIHRRARAISSVVSTSRAAESPVSSPCIRMRPVKASARPSPTPMVLAAPAAAS